MRFGFVIPGGDVRNFGKYAAECEQAGWNGVFVADGLALEMDGKPFPWFDPVVALSAMAVATETIKIGTFLSAVPRRRPWKLAREFATLDQLSSGRMILSAGLGAAKDDGGFFKVGEPMDLSTRAELLDEALAIMSGLWKGKPYTFRGKHYNVDKLAMQPPPVQRPRVPIWVVGVFPKERSMRRALSWDGLIPQRYKATPSDVIKVDELIEIRHYVKQHRKKSGSFEIILGGTTPGDNRKRALSMVKPFADAGATWWLEHLWSGDQRKVIKRIQQGPPALG